MKTFLAGILAAVAITGSAVAHDGPKFLTETYPPHALEGLLKMYGSIKSDQNSLDAKAFELIGLAVAAQILCQYCVYAHTKQAKLAGATDEEIREAVAMAGSTRNFAAVFNGMAYDFEAFIQEHDALVPPPSN